MPRLGQAPAPQPCCDAPLCSGGAASRFAGAPRMPENHMTTCICHVTFEGGERHALASAESGKMLSARVRKSTGMMRKQKERSTCAWKARDGEGAERRREKAREGEGR